MTNETGSQKRLGTVIFYAIVALLVYLVYLVVAPFLVPLSWAAVLVVASHPVHAWMSRRWGRTRAAMAATAGVTLVLIVPAVFVMIAFVRQSVDAVHSIEVQAVSGQYARLEHLWTRIQVRVPEANLDDLTTALRRYGEQAAGYLAGRLGTILGHTATFLFDLGVTILGMFYIYRDGDSILVRVRELLPFEATHRERMLDDARDLIFASLASGLLAAGAHGTLGGVAFALAGIKSPVFWGVMMGFFSLVPLVGSALIWVPIAISLAIGGHLGRGILVAIFCSLLVGLVDNLIRPWLISGRAEMGGLVVFISVLGGISVFGMLGVVLGPIVVATAASLLDLYVPRRPARNTRPKASGHKTGAVLE
ncbi:MAG TPA: AI-2E family transporter [Verrucomicrobiae bacterium]|nr:AI-2E family transporter [Verrucomicrobiae bacterium]